MEYGVSNKKQELLYTENNKNLFFSPKPPPSFPTHTRTLYSARNRLDGAGSVEDPAPPSAAGAAGRERGSAKGTVPSADDFGVSAPAYPVIGAFSNVVIVSWMPLKYFTVFTVSSAVASSSHTMQALA